MTSAVADYAAAVEAACADLSAEQRQALLADLPEYLSEVAVNGPLQAQLGSPEQYADQIRAAAELPARTSAATPADPSAWVRVRLEARPVWWVLRCYVAVWAIVLLIQPGGWTYSQNTFPFPAPFGWPSLGLIATLLLIPASFWLGHRQLPRPASVAWVCVQVVATLYVLAFVVQVFGDQTVPSSRPSPNYEYSCCQAGDLRGPHHAGDLLALHWLANSNGWSYQPSPVMLDATLARPVGHLAPGTGAAGATIATANRLHVSSATGSPLVSRLRIPNNIEPGYYRVTLHVHVAGGGDTIAATRIKVVK